MADDLITLYGAILYSRPESTPPTPIEHGIAASLAAMDLEVTPPTTAELVAAEVRLDTGPAHAAQAPGRAVVTPSGLTARWVQGEDGYTWEVIGLDAPQAQVPEPSMIWLFGLALIGIVAVRPLIGWFRRRAERRKDIRP